MSAPAKPVDLLGGLSEALAGEVALHLVTDGQVTDVAGGGDGSTVTCEDGEIRIDVPDGRSAFRHELPDGTVAILTYDTGAADALQPFLGGLFAMLEQKHLVEADMESIQPASLALLEEVSMYNDTLPSLSTGSSEVDIVEMGLKALVMASSLSRAMYLRYDCVAERCEMLVHITHDRSGRHAVSVTPDPHPLLPEAGDIVWSAIRGGGGAVFKSFEAGDERASTGPELLAEREIVAVPVSYGSDEKQVALGVLLVLDKRANAYSNSVNLGSQETKFATAIASMLGSVLGARKVAELGKELHMAKAIQSQILPDRPAEIPGYDLAGRCTNSGAVGGDYFDYLPMRDGRTLVVVADVSGHNLASGMLMVGARSTLRALASQNESPSVVFDEVARALYGDLTRTERFITAVGAALSPTDDKVHIANAGHNDSMIYRHATGDVERIPSDATVLGFLPDSEHGEREVVLRPGDVMLLYTDGVVEATDDDGEMMGEERLVEIFRRESAGTAEQILEAVYREVESYSSRSGQDDDVTAVVIKAMNREGEPG